MVEIFNWFQRFFFVGAVFVAACKPSATTPADTIALGLHQFARLASEVVVRADTIQNSRCPTGTTCIWAGLARVRLLLSKDTASTTVRLALGAGVNQDKSTRSDSTNVSLNSEQFKVILRDVTPYPTAPAQNQTQTAIVQVTKL